MAIALLALSLHASSVAVAAPASDDFIKRAVFANGALWLLTDGGRLSSIRPESNERVSQAIPGIVADVCLWSSVGPTVLVQTGGPANAWKVYDRVAGGDWAHVLNGGKLKRGERLMALACRTNSKTAAVLTTRQLVLLSPDEIGLIGTTSVAIKQSQFGVGPNVGVITATYSTDAATLVGFNAGEWGGDLYRIDHATGEVRNAQVLSPAQEKMIQSGAAPAADDPTKPRARTPDDDIFLGNINGIEPEPGKPDCFIVAVGVVHFTSSGALVELCGGKARTFYSKVFKRPDNAVFRGDQSIAFFSLTRVGDDLWAAGIDGLYHFKPGGAVDFRPMPKFHNVGGVWVNFDDPHLALVITEINGRTSMSDGAPLLVPH